MDYYILHFDASVRPTNPGGIGQYAYTIHCGGEEIKEEKGSIGQWKDLTNNFAEFFALYRGLEKIQSIIDYKSTLEVKGDSNLVINLMTRKWKGKKDHEWYKVYKECEKIVKILRKRKISVYFSWIPRESNQRCDFLSKQKFFT